MDYQFTAQGNNIVAKCSMEHEAVANWLNTEVQLNSSLISTALLAIAQAKQQSQKQEICLTGHEYSLFIQGDEVLVKANNLALSSLDELEPDFNYYDQESIALCGLDDFEGFLHSYLAFKG